MQGLDPAFAMSAMSGFSAAIFIEVASPEVSAGASLIPSPAAAASWPAGMTDVAGWGWEAAGGPGPDDPVLTDGPMP